MSRYNSVPRWRHQVLERATRCCGHLFGLSWSGSANARVANDRIVMAGRVRFSSSGLSCLYELTMPADPNVTSPQAEAFLRLPLSPAQAGDPGWIASAVDVLNSRAVGMTVLLHEASGCIVLCSAVVLSSCAASDEPSRESLQALTDATSAMVERLLSVGEDWWTICANLDYQLEHH